MPGSLKAIKKAPLSFGDPAGAFTVDGDVLFKSWALYPSNQLPSVGQIFDFPQFLPPSKSPFLFSQGLHPKILTLNDIVGIGKFWGNSFRQCQIGSVLFLYYSALLNGVPLKNSLSRRFWEEPPPTPISFIRSL